MRYLALILILFLCLWATSGAFAQEEDDYRKEFDYGVNFNTRGGLIGGVMIRSTTYLKDSWYKHWGVELVEVKHPKERGNRYASQETGDPFVYGKSNYLYVLRPEVGLERVFFRKAPESGVQVNGIVAAGPSFGFLVPYYIFYNYAPMDANKRFIGPEDIQIEQYNPDIHTDIERRIYGKAGFLQGINQAKPNMGVHLRLATSFEYGRYWESVTGIETGFVFEAFTKDLVIIPQAQNTNVFSSVYLTLYYGRRR